MKMQINVRPLVAELFENEYLIISYTEIEGNGFDLIVRINHDKIEEENRLQQIKGVQQ